MSKFPLLQKEQTTRIISTTEGTEIEKLVYGRNVKPTKDISTKEEIDDYYNQLLQAMLYYGNLMDRPYTISMPVGVTHPLYDYCVEADKSGHFYALFSKLGVLKPSERNKRYELYEKLKDNQVAQLNMLNNKSTIKIDDVVEGLVNNEE